ncbi:MAG TPA: TIGR00730 family Rossman fold protein [Nocardioidaceae bacterium]|nr:TIGR00730 family Rossman fold protein [Nocardioidaceae bacterium]
MRFAVFTGSSDGTDGHRRLAADLASHLAAAGHGIVYGGAQVGLMGVVADTALAAGGEVIGVIPRHLVVGEIAHRGLTRLEVVETMHERKARMAQLADAFVALPGGAGTLEELFEVFTWGQLGLHTKPTAILDPDGFYSPLLGQLDVMRELGYVRPAHRDSLGAARNVEELLAWVAAYEHPRSKWTGERGG